jgi:ubiquinone/menaquinone biosynthesis C-methylase UbiE
MSGAAEAWQVFERDPAGYDAWYGTPRGQRADRAERALLNRLLAPFSTARSALEVGCGTGHFTRWLAGSLPRVAGLDRAWPMLVEAQRRHPGLSLIHGDALDLPIRGRAVDLSVFVLTLEFVERPDRALAEAVRVARQGVLVVALNRWSLGGFSRRWGRDARGSMLSRAQDFTLASLRGRASTAAGSRFRAFRWASALFPDGLAQAPARIWLGDVIGIAVELTP